MQSSAVKAWNESVSIPTYPHGEPNPNPMFLERRVYQGSSGAVYPFPVIDKIFDDKVDRVYDAVYLENQYLKIMLLPCFGGRVQMALDKTNDYHFVYYNRVIKPALVGLAGPWISGGIEFNWPQHHRPSTFMPVAHWIDDAGDDGSKTVYISEIDRMFGTRMVAGFTLHPEKAYLQIDVKLYNRTGEPQTFLWWANPAVAAGEHHQTVMPPDVHAVMDHGKRDVSSFPIATGTYYKMDYGANDAGGTDISRYRNIPVPTSYMAYHSDFDFVASYDHEKKAGLLHVANHHLSPGKKQWTWGHGDFGQAWDRQLTDEDGPYIELMCGVFTDNQPDFSWLNPYEEKRFTQYFMPYKGVGMIKNASTEAAIGLEFRERRCRVAAYVTSPRENLKLVLTNDSGKSVYETTIGSLTPESSFEDDFEAPGSGDGCLTLRLLDGDRELLNYTPVTDTPPIPKPAKPVLPPEKVRSCEQLFLSGQHLEQYRHATLDPEPYYREAIRREPGDIRSNNALGLLLYRRGLFEEAEVCFAKAVETQLQRNPNPYDGEPHFNLGLALRKQGKLDEAFDAFHKSVWNVATAAQANFELAKIEAVRGQWASAVHYCEESLINNWCNHKARHLKIAALRKLGRNHDARKEAELSVSLDPMESAALRELSLLGDDAAGKRLKAVINNDPHNRIELALDYAAGGLFDDASAILSANGSSHTISLYLEGWICTLAGNEIGAAAAFGRAAKASPVLVMPNRLEERLALEAAVRHNRSDGVAWYLLGTLQYAKRDYHRAIRSWQQACPLLPGYATVRRNLALGYANVHKDAPRALRVLEEAFMCDPSDARVLFELDQLRKKQNVQPSERLAKLEEHSSLIETRDDLFIEHCNLLILLGEYHAALKRIADRRFHPWEGGEGKATGAYVAALLGLARDCLEDGEFEQALQQIERSRHFPQNLGEGKLIGALENDANYLAGLAYRGLGNEDRARTLFDKARFGLDEPASAMFYNDQPPSMILYQGLAAAALGLSKEAAERFDQLVDYGSKHLHDDGAVDFFAVSLPEFQVFDSQESIANAIHCHYMAGLGYLGRQKTGHCRDANRARRHFEEVIALDASHLGAVTHLALLKHCEQALEPVRSA